MRHQTNKARYSTSRPEGGVSWLRALAGLVAAAVIAFSAASVAQEGGSSAPTPPTPPAAGQGKPELTVDALSVVKVRSRAISNARSSRSLGPQREGTGVVIGSDGLVLTIGYLIVEADTVELSTADGKAFPATVVAYDNATGFGLLKSLRPLPVKPVQFGQSANVGERELVLIVGFDGVAPAYVVSRRPFVGYWEYLLDDAIYTAPATVNWSGAALLNREGKLLGIGSLVVGDSMGTRAQVPGNMFVPIDLLKPILGELKERGLTRSSQRAWLGVNCVEHEGQIRVVRLTGSGPAEEAGVQPGDQIVRIDGVAVSDLESFYKTLWQRDAEREVTLDSRRAGSTQSVKVQAIDRMKTLRRPEGV